MTTVNKNLFISNQQKSIQEGLKSFITTWFMIFVIWTNNPISKWTWSSTVDSFQQRSLRDSTKLKNLEFNVLPKEETSSNHEQTTELARLGTRSCMCLEEDEQLLIEQNSSTTSWCLTKKRNAGEMQARRKEMPLILDLDMCKSVFTTTYLYSEVKEQITKSMETSGCTISSKKIG